MGALSFYLLLFCILAVANGSTPDCVGEKEGIPSNHTQISGLWNLIALSLCPSFSFTIDYVTYTYANISFTEKDGHFLVFFDPLTEFQGVDFYYERIPGTPHYKYVTKEVESIVRFAQTQPDSMISYEKINGTLCGAFLHSKGASLPEDEIEKFKEWSKCNGFDRVKVLKPSISYAQVCHGHFEISENLKELKDTETWSLIAKASTYPDHHYHIRLLYSAKLEISKKGKEYTVREIQIVSVVEKTLMELKYEEGVTRSTIKLLEFKTGENMLLLGVQSEAGRTLYLASKTPTVNQSYLEEFDVHAKCFQGNYTYFISGRKEEDTDESEICTKIQKEVTPITLKEFLGKWSLTTSADGKTNSSLVDVSVASGWMEFNFVNDKPHLSYVSINEVGVQKVELENIEAEETDGHLIFKDPQTELKSIIYGFGPNCVISSDLLKKSPEGTLLLFCRENANSSVATENFSRYSTCQNLKQINEQKHTSTE
ncbi:uncharacterized protein LOC121397773 [Xenopus laevis]|uniref:Uncharacterized protein LOC121397773 n=2 Tax=Xenopus laevis TaxID=8355 RepID=A0A1L8F3N5_XENLA|nr:uncharacterized protein LOC121397773 [Xenopus laevis]OCT66206.1 hypothetical protein XELAEV_18042463mg [Xenopus laevis]